MKTHKERIGLQDTTLDIFHKLSEGNPGALTVLTLAYTNAAEIDPQAMFGGLGALLGFDSLGIYGPDIWVLYKDQCGCDIREVLMLQRAWQLGFLSGDKLREIAADHNGQVRLSKEEMDDFNKQVCDRLEDFRRREVKKDEETTEA